MFSILWSIASIARLSAKRKPFHPGADVGVDLLIFLLLVPTIVFALLGPANQWRFEGPDGIDSSAGKLELVVIIDLILLL